jgi:cholesterol transport system auxiliary component
MSRPQTLVAVAACLLSGCAFFGKTEPLDARFYSAERSVAPTQSSPVQSEAPLRLGSISGATHLRELIAYRESEREVGFYQGRRWTERPEAYLQRALAQVLFEQRGMQRVTSGMAPTLDVELTHFDELLGAPHRVKVQAHVVLRDRRSARFEHTFGAEQEVRGGDFVEVAEALSVALGRCVDEIADRVVAELRARPPVPLEAPAPEAATTPSSSMSRPDADVARAGARP